MTKNLREVTITHATSAGARYSRRWHHVISSVSELRSLLIVACTVVVAMTWSLHNAGKETEQLNSLAAVLVLELSTDPEVVSRLGAPLSVDGQASGRISTIQKPEQVDMIVPVAGWRGRGSLQVEAMREHDRWKVTTLVLRIAGEETPLDLHRVNRMPGEEGATQ